ncbi:hypothetical protein LCGC14_1330900, partial [marine sediment metagenome]|nr:DUF2817 domain-containing protein [Pricia sp.]
MTSKNYKSIKVSAIKGRYLAYPHLKDFLDKNVKLGNLEVEGESVLKTSIVSIKYGKGPKKILMWSQMHGNESTTTKAVLDIVNFLEINSPSAQSVLDSCTILILPMLNPDGAAAYTRINANQVDLNRDAQQRSQPESVVLRNVFDAFLPDYCFNLHDQRTIFNVGNTPNPATVSFLAPAHDEERSISASRAESMRLIAAMNGDLQKRIPGQVGRYDDAFNSDCVGDTFQMTGTPTILFEAGHFPEDYNRERTREYIFHALISALNTISKDKIGDFKVSEYFAIPENEKQFFDVIIYNAHVILPSLQIGESIGILYVEKLIDETIIFEPQVESRGNLNSHYGHKTFNMLINSDLMYVKNDIK